MRREGGNQGPMQSTAEWKTMIQNIPVRVGSPLGEGVKGRAVFSSKTTGKKGKEINARKLLANKDVEGRDVQPLCVCFVNKSRWTWALLSGGCDTDSWFRGGFHES